MYLFALTLLIAFRNGSESDNANGAANDDDHDSKLESWSPTLTTAKTTPTTTMMMFTSDLVSVAMFAWQFGHTVVTESGPKRILIENIVDTFIETKVFAAFGCWTPVPVGPK